MKRSPLLAAVLLLPACASLNVNSDMTSMVDPAWRPEAMLERVLVFAATADIEARQSIEDRFGRRATLFVPSYALFFPGRAFTDEEVQATLDEHVIDAVLILEGGEDGVNTSTWTSPTQSDASASCTGYGSAVNCSGTGTTTGGQTYTFSKPWATYTARLYDRRAGLTVWTASGQVSGNAFASMGQMREMAVRETIEQLMKDGVIR